MDLHTLQDLGNESITWTDKRNPMSAPNEFRRIEERAMTRSTRVKRPSRFAKEENIHSTATDPAPYAACAERSKFAARYADLLIVTSMAGKPVMVRLPTTWVAPLKLPSNSTANPITVACTTRLGVCG